jgi:hypothetical protein
MPNDNIDILYGIEATSFVGRRVEPATLTYEMMNNAMQQSINNIRLEPSYNFILSPLWDQFKIKSKRASNLPAWF